MAESADENDMLRHRIIDLECMLVEAAETIENLKKEK